MSITENIGAKLVASVLALAMVVTMLFTFAPQANAQSALSESQIQSILNLLSSFGADQTTINNVDSALRGQPTSGGGGSTGSGSSVCPYTWTRSLDNGATGADVMKLQQFLNDVLPTPIASSGAGSPGAETSYYGSITGAGVKRFQEMYRAQVLDPLGLANGTTYFGPSTRAQANKVCQSGGSTSGGGSGSGSGSGGGTTGGGLSITAVGDRSLMAVPKDVSGQTFGVFNFTAGNSDVEVTGMTIGRKGAGSKDDFDNVWVTANGVQHGNERSILTGDTATFTFNSASGGPIMVPAGQTVTVRLNGSFASPGSGQYNTLTIKSVNTNGTVNASFPVEGIQTVTSGTSASKITFTPQGSDRNVPVGSKQTELGRFKLDVNGRNDQSVRIKSIKFENNGAASDLTEVTDNLKIRVGGQTISSSANYIGNDDVQFMFSGDGYVMEDGKTQSFTIIGDITSAESGDTIQFQLDEDFHLEAVESADNGFGVRIEDSDGNLANNENLKTYTLETGDVTFSINSASSRTVSPGLDDIVFIDGTLKVESAFRADGMFARVVSGTSISGSDFEADVDSNFDDVTFKIDGLTIDTVDTLTNGGTDTSMDTGSSGDYYDFSSQFTVEAGTHSATVEADIKSGATSGDKMKLQLFAGDLESPEYIDTGDTISSSELVGNSLGSLISIQSGSLTLTRNDGFSSETVIGGATDVVFFRFTITANDSSDLEVNSVTFDHDTGTYTTSDVTNMRLFIDGEQVGSAVDLSNGVFSDVNFTVPESQQVQAELRVDLNTVTSSKTLQIDLEDMSITDEEGNSVTATVGSSDLAADSNELTSDTFTIATGGSFTLDADGNSPDEDIIIGDSGATWIPIVTYRLTAQDEDLKLTDLYVMNATSTDDVQASTTFADSRIQSLGLFDEGGVLKGSRTLSSGATHFDLGSNVSANGLGAVVVPGDDFTKVTVRAKVNSIVDADKTGRLLRLVVDPTQGTGNTGVTVQSTSVGDDLSSSSIVAARDDDGGSSNGTIRATSTASDFFAMRRTKPTITIPSQSTTNLTSGSSKRVFKFTVAADANEDVAWKGIKFDVEGRFGGNDLSSTTGANTFASSNPGATVGFATTTTHSSSNLGARVNKFRLYEDSTGKEVQNGDYKVHTDWDSGDDVGELAFVMNDTKEEIVSAGNSKTYRLEVSLAGVTNNGDFLDIAIDSEADDAATSAYLVQGSDPEEVDGGADKSNIQMTVSTATNPYAFLWSDNSGSPHSAADDNDNADQQDWTNDRFVDIDNSSWNFTASF